LVQWVNIFTDYAKRHPKRYQEPFAFVVLAALQEASPLSRKVKLNGEINGLVQREQHGRERAKLTLSETASALPPSRCH